MTKKELIVKITKETELSQQAASNVIESITEQVCALLCRGDRITLSGFGTFSTKNRAQREGRNPQTGESIVIPAHRAVKFSASKNRYGYNLDAIACYHSGRGLSQLNTVKRERTIKYLRKINDVLTKAYQ